MSAVMKEPRVNVISQAASQADWCECGPGIQIKVLAVDSERHSVEYLARTGAGHNAGRHRHHSESYIYVIDGSVINHTTGCTFAAGDFCYQPDKDEHIEESGPDGVTVFASQRGDGDLLVEFFDDAGAVCSEFRVSDFARLLS